MPCAAVLAASVLKPEVDVVGRYGPESVIWVLVNVLQACRRWEMYAQEQGRNYGIDWIEADGNKA